MGLVLGHVSTFYMEFPTLGEGASTCGSPPEKKTITCRTQQNRTMVARTWQTFPDPLETHPAKTIGGKPSFSRIASVNSTNLLLEFLHVTRPGVSKE